MVLELKYFVNCPESNLNLLIINTPATVGADATVYIYTVYVWFLGQIYVKEGRTFIIASAPAVTGSDFYLCGNSDSFWDSVYCTPDYNYVTELTKV